MKKGIIITLVAIATLALVAGAAWYFIQADRLKGGEEERLKGGEEERLIGEEVKREVPGCQNRI